jgi:hypothetical protein
VAWLEKTLLLARECKFSIRRVTIKLRVTQATEEAYIPMQDLMKELNGKGIELIFSFGYKEKK